VSEPVFEHDAAFRQGELSGNLELGEVEARYEQLFAEAIEDGIITTEERTRLAEAAESMGLDARKLEQLEQAMQASYLQRHGRGVLELGRVFEAETPVASVRLEPDEQSPELLRQRIAYLESRNKQLEQELDQVLAQVAVEIDVSDLGDADREVGEDPDGLRRRLRHDPRDADVAQQLYASLQRRADVDGQWCLALALDYLGEATDEQQELLQRYRNDGLIRPTRSVDANGWRRLLFHRDDEVLTGEIFGAIVTAVLLGHVGALRAAGTLPRLDRRRLQDPKSSTVQAVRCFSWAAATLGMAPPPLYADPDYEGLVQMVPAVPPASRLGKLALSGRSPAELAFVAGKHLANYRGERFIRLLVPEILHLQDLFLASLTIGAPHLPLDSEVRTRVRPIAEALEPILEPLQKDQLRNLFQRFVHEGGRTNLLRWATATDHTAVRTGFALANDLRTAQAMLELGGAPTLRADMDDLLVFCASTRYSKLRRQMGIALPPADEVA